MSARHLLTPGKEATVPFPQDYLFSRWVSKGSRLLLTVNVNKNAFAEINYGTGRDVGTEDIHDAGTPLKVDWLTSSYIRLRLRAQGRSCVSTVLKCLNRARSSLSRRS